MAQYITKQQQAVLDFLRSHEDAQISALDLLQHLRTEGSSVGLATVYRQLEKLEGQGLLHKISTEEGAVYQYCSKEQHEDCFLMKCEQCGRIIHADCEKLGGLYEHLEADHHFRINARKTVFYGLCQQCSQEVSR